MSDVLSGSLSESVSLSFFFDTDTDSDSNPEMERFEIDSREIGRLLMRVSILPQKMMAVLLSAVLFFFSFILYGFNSKEKVTLIGIASTVSLQSEIMEGFKAGMTEAGYIEGKNLKYLYRDIAIPDEKHIDNAIHELMSQSIDLLVSMGYEVDFRAKVFANETGTPALFMASLQPVEKGLVESIRHPGGNITGVKVADSVPKALEWLLKIAPDTELVYLPYNPEDLISGDVIGQLGTISQQLGIELRVQKVQSMEEALADIETLPEKISAVFLIPSPTLDICGDELNRKAVKRKIPLGTAISTDKSILMSFINDFFNAGKKASRLARQILSGVKPGDLPVETAETSLILNVKTAEEIGLSIPGAVLIQASVINR